MSHDLLQQLIEAFAFLPGVGRKTAQRFAYFVLAHDPRGGACLASMLETALEKIVECQGCRMFSEESVCSICRDVSRDKKLLCVVENPASLMAVESSTNFQGTYFVLHGYLSPLDGIGPEEIKLDVLKTRLQKEAVQEIVLATGTTVEGSVTAHVISEMASKLHIRTTRLAQGIPAGGDLEMVDATTLTWAFDARRDYSSP